MACNLAEDPRATFVAVDTHALRVVLETNTAALDPTVEEAGNAEEDKLICRLLTPQGRECTYAPSDSTSFGWSGTGRDKATDAKTELKVRSLSRVECVSQRGPVNGHRVECDEGTYPAQNPREISVVKSGWEKKSQTDEDASRQVKLSETGEHKTEGDATNEDVAVEGLWTEYDPSTSTREK